MSVYKITNYASFSKNVDFIYILNKRNQADLIYSSLGNKKS